jgi:uncharacterized protein (TIGR03437 family)
MGIIARCGLFLCVALSWQLAAQGPAFDASGNGVLQGTYSFRHVLYVPTPIPDANGIAGDLGQTVAVYGNISFDGNGHYTIANGVVLDSDIGFTSALSCYLSFAVCDTGVPVSGYYSISASGFGFILNPISEDLIYGSVSANGIFAGSSTETTLTYNDLFIAAPVASTPQTNASFKGSYTVAGFIPAADAQSSADVFFQMNPDGAGNLGTVNISGYSGGGPGTISQNSVATYSFSGGAATINFPVSDTANFFSGPEVICFSPDGSFFFGGSQNGGFDMIVGVANNGTQDFGGLYYQAGLDQDLSQVSNGTADLDGYYGAFNALADGNIADHQRVNDQNNGIAGMTFADSFPVPVTGSYPGTALSAQYAVGAGGAIRIGEDVFPMLGVSVALLAPTPIIAVASLGPPVILNPQGIVNAASSAPFTAGVSAGELVTLSGVNLSATTVTASTSFYPTMLGGVQVVVNGIAAPVSSVSPGAVTAVVPYEIASAVAAFQVINNGTASNVVTELVNQTTPGVFTVPGGDPGFGDGVETHDADGTPVSPSSPAQPGESVDVFLSGLGVVSPAVPDGAAATSTTPSTTSSTITANIGGVPATVSFSGLAAGLAGTYEVILQIPSGLTPGEDTLGISGPDSSAVQATISIGSGQAAGRPSGAQRLRSRRTGAAKWKRPCFSGPGQSCGTE